MEFNHRLVLTENSIKRHSKRLQKHFETIGHHYSTTQSQQIFAQILGVKDWHELQGILGNYADKPLVNQSQSLSKIYIPPMDINNTQGIEQLFNFLSTLPGALTVDIRSGMPVHLHYKESRFMGDTVVSDSQVEALMNYLGKKQDLLQIYQGIDVDFRFRYKGEILFFFNVTGMMENGRVIPSISLKKFATTTASINELIEDKSLLTTPDKLFPKQGMVLVVGSTSSNKEDILHGLIQHRIDTTNDKIVNCEFPCEFEYKTEGKSAPIINLNPENIIKVLRRKPDTIVLAEIRSQEHMADLVTAAMTGHATYGCMYSTTIVQTIERSINIFPPAERNARFLDLITSLKTIIATHTIMGKNGKHLNIQESLHFTEDIIQHILEARDPGISNPNPRVMRDMVEQHGQTYIKSALAKYKGGLVTEEVMEGVIKSSQL